MVLRNIQGKTLSITVKEDKDLNSKYSLLNIIEGMGMHLFLLGNVVLVTQQK